MTDRTSDKRREILNNALAQRPDPRPKEGPWRDLQGLTWQEDLFVSRLDAGADIGESYIAAGFKSSSLVKARAAGRRLLRKPYVKAELDRRVEIKGRARAEAAKIAIEHSGITLARVAAELGRVAFSNMLDYIRIDPATGDPSLDWAGLTREQAAALNSLVTGAAGASAAAGLPSRHRARDAPHPHRRNRDQVRYHCLWLIKRRTI